MKKRKTAKKSYKRKINYLKKCKMSLKEKEFVVITIFAVFVFAFLLAVTNVPHQSVTITGHVVSGVDFNTQGKIGSILTNFINPENADPTVIKWIVFFTFALGIWGVISLFFERGKGGVIKLLSIPLAFAMVYLLKPEEIFAGLIGYSALGMTIIVLLPFLAIIFFSVRLLERKLTAAKIITQLLVWYFYLAFLIYFLIRAFFATETYSLGVLLIISGGILVSIFAIWKNKWLRNKIAEFNREGLAKEIEDLQHALGAKEKKEYERGAQAQHAAWAR